MAPNRKYSLCTTRVERTLQKVFVYESAEGKLILLQPFHTVIESILIWDSQSILLLCDSLFMSRNNDCQ